MSVNLPPAKKPDMLPKIKDYLQIAVWTTALITILGTWVANWIIPNWALFLVLPSFFNLALYFYLWRRMRRSTYGTWTQHFCLLAIVQSVWSGIYFFGKGDSYNIVVGSLWVVAGVGWVVYSAIAGYETDSYIAGLELSIISCVKWDDLSPIIDRISETQNKLVNSLDTLAEVQRALTEGQRASVEVQRLLAERIESEKLLACKTFAAE